jgi:hypothetical protein
MDRLVVAIDPAVGVGAGDLSLAWAADEEARGLGEASVEGSAPGQFLPGLVELVVVPLVVNVASEVLSTLVRRVLDRVRRGQADSGASPADGVNLVPGGAPADVVVEVSETAPGQRVVVVRVAGAGTVR